MSKFAKSVLGSALLTPSQTNRWLKPHSHTSSVTVSVGAPWEIYRANTLTLDGRTIDIYTKDGGIGEYGSFLALVPDYNITVTLLTAGSTIDLAGPVETALRAMIPAVDKAARDDASRKYVGLYKDISSKSNMSVILTNAGLRIESLFNNGKDILSAYASVFQPFELGIYPTGLQYGIGPGSEKDLTKQSSEGESWRGVYNFINQPYDGFLRQCASWAGLDGNVYGQKALDEFIFDTDAKGQVISVRNSALRTILAKR